MLTFVARTWPWVLARGIIAALAGLTTMVWPGLTLEVVAAFIGFWLIFDGIGLIINAFSVQGATGGERALFGIFGLISLVAGVVALTNIFATLQALAIILAVWFVASGIAQIATALRIRRFVTGEWMLILVGVIGILCGILTLFAPASVLTTAAIMFGALALVYGIAAIIASLRLRSLVKQAGSLVKQADAAA